VLLLLLVLAAGVLVLIVEAPPRPSGPASARGPRVLRLRPASVKRLEIRTRTRELAAVHTPSGWQLDGAPASAGVSDALDGLVEALAELRAVDAFRPGDRTALGIDTPDVTITLRTGRRERRLRLGASNASGSALYAERDGHPRVFLVGAGVLSAIERVFYQRDLATPPPAHDES
jgi:hypothetical protein